MMYDTQVSDEGKCVAYFLTDALQVNKTGEKIVNVFYFITISVGLDKFT